MSPSCQHLVSSALVFFGAAHAPHSQELAARRSAVTSSLRIEAGSRLDDQNIFQISASTSSQSDPQTPLMFGLPNYRACRASFWQPAGLELVKSSAFKLSHQQRPTKSAEQTCEQQPRFAYASCMICGACFLRTSGLCFNDPCLLVLQFLVSSGLLSKRGPTTRSRPESN